MFLLCPEVSDYPLKEEQLQLKIKVSLVADELHVTVLLSLMSPLHTLILPHDVSSRFADVLWGLVLKTGFGCTRSHLEGDNGRRRAVQTQIRSKLCLFFAMRENIRSSSATFSVALAVWQSYRGVQPCSDCETYYGNVPATSNSWWIYNATGRPTGRQIVRRHQLNRL